MSATVLLFFHVCIIAAEGGWLVLYRSHGWHHGNRDEAMADARWIANGVRVFAREVAS